MEPFQKRLYIHRGSFGSSPSGSEHRGSFSGLPAGFPVNVLERRRYSSGSGKSEKRGSVSFLPVGSSPGYGTFKDSQRQESEDGDDETFSSMDVLWKAERRLSKVSVSGIENPVFVEEVEFKEINLGRGADVRRRSLGYLKKELEIDYHQVPIATLYNRYGTDPNKGLTEDQRKRNLEFYGKNALTPPKKEHVLVTFLKTLIGGFQLLLWAGGILSFAAYVAQCFESDNPPSDNLWLGIVLIVLVIVLGLFTFYQEYSSSRIMESFTKMVPSYASVIREGQTHHVNANELVVGDIVEVKFGDRIPADIRILEASGFKVDNSSLTGESEPQSRSPLCTNENPMETKNLAFFSSNALEGTAKGLVVSVGDNTFIGRIAGLTSGLDSSDTPMAREVARFVKLISALAVFFGVAFFAISLVMGYKWIDAILFLIGIIVANVPEGLIVTFTVILALTAKRMADKNCLVKNLHAVETLGSCSVICSDKTGTLTQNKMTVSHMWFNNEVLDTKVDEVKGETHLKNHCFQVLSTVASLCSRAKFLANQEAVPIPQRVVDGDASESAILRTMEHYLDGVEKFQTAHKKVFEIPFNSTNKYQVSIHDMNDPEDPRYLLVMKVRTQVFKGAPERILDICTKFTIGEGVVELDDDWRVRFNTVYELLGGLGERVIGFCNLRLPLEMYPPGYKFSIENTDFIDIGLEFAGLISMIDPPRPGVADAVQTCRSAGIKVVMVTGDHPITAKAIARSVGIISDGTDTVEDIAQKMGLEPEDVDPSLASAAVITGLKLTDMNSEELDDCLRNHSEIVFARVSPQQKLIIVEGFQRLGRIVAVTGDGVNDSPALKKADIGIAMGIAGSDVSKQAADMILLDDNFASIVTGVEEGRLIFDNLKKCICYLLTANIAELTPFVAYICLRIPLPLGTIPMLLICLGTDIMPTISLSYEKAEGDIMKRPARDPVKDNLVTDKLISYSYGQLGLIESAAGFFTYFIVMGQNGFTPSRLLEIGSDWDNAAINDLEDAYGQEWSYSSRELLLHTCWTAYFIAVVVCQWGNVLISKTRRVSLIHKLFDNWVVFFAIIFMTCLACFFSYTPGMSAAIGMEYIKINWWLPPLPFFCFIIIYDEIRRFIMRNFNWSWYEKEFYY